MAALSVIFDGLQLNSASRKYLIAEGPDYGSQAIADELLTGEYRLGELDQVAAEKRLRRVVRLPLRVNSVSQSAMATDQQALTSRLAAASIIAPKTMTVTLKDSTAVSTFKVFGGSWAPSYDQVSESQDVMFGTLTLVCDWPVWGATQSLGSSGAPLVSNTASPAAVTLSPSPVGDAAGDVTLFVKNRAASPIRSLIAAGVSGDTTWTAGSGQAGWTLDTGARTSGVVYNQVATAQGTVAITAHFTAPTLPSDRVFRVYLRATHFLTDGGAQFRIRLVSGAAEVIGPWRSLPPEISQNSLPRPANAADMGAYTFPVGSVGSLGAQSTTVYIEYTQTVPLVSGNSVGVIEALFVPDFGAVIAETGDTSKTIAAASGIVQLESDQLYASTGDPAGGVLTGAHLRTQGGRYHVYTSQGFMGSLDTTLPWSPENVDVWATYTPRYIGLAA